MHDRNVHPFELDKKKEVKMFPVRQKPRFFKHERLHLGYLFSRSIPGHDIQSANLLPSHKSICEDKR